MIRQMHTKLRCENLKERDDFGDAGEEPNIAAEWLALLLRIREVPGSNLGPEI
jgi:hypothetical protein